MKPRERLELLKKMLGLDFSDLEKSYQEIFSERMVVNKSIAGYIAKFEEMPEPAPDTPEEEVSFRDELQKLNILIERKQVFD